MQFIWTFRSLPELNHLDDGQRRDLIRRCVTWRTRLGLVGRSAAVGFVGGMMAMSVVVGHGLPWQAVLAGVVVVMAAAGVAWVQFEFLRIRAALRLHLKRLRGHRLPMCLTCGYNLTGTTGDRCSECGSGVVVPGTSGAKA